MTPLRAGLVLLTALALAACSSSGPSSGSGAGASSGGGSSAPVSAPAKGIAPASDTSGPGTSAPVSDTSSAPPSAAQRDQQLTAQTNGEDHALVTVPGGYEAAVYDQHGTIEFWGVQNSAAQWSRLGASSYPVVTQLGPPQAQVSGALLHGMQHATFIVHGVFTGDGSGNAVAYTDGPHGWGAIKAEPSGNIGPSGHPVGSDQIGLSFDFGFVGGQLETKDCPTNRPIYQCGAHPVIKLWVWTGQDFRLAS